MNKKVRSAILGGLVPAVLVVVAAFAPHFSHPTTALQVHNTGDTFALPDETTTEPSVTTEPPSTTTTKPKVKVAIGPGIKPDVPPPSDDISSQPTIIGTALVMEESTTTTTTPPIVYGTTVTTGCEIEGVTITLQLSTWEGNTNLTLSAGPLHSFGHVQASGTVSNDSTESSFDMGGRMYPQANQPFSVTNDYAGGVDDTIVISNTTCTP